MVQKKEFTASEAARVLKIDLAYVYRLIWSGKLPARKEGPRWLIPAGAIDARQKQREATHA